MMHVVCHDPECLDGERVDEEFWPARDFADRHERETGHETSMLAVADA